MELESCITTVASVNMSSLEHVALIRGCEVLAFPAPCSVSSASEAHSVADCRSGVEDVTTGMATCDGICVVE